MVKLRRHSGIMQQPLRGNQDPIRSAPFILEAVDAGLGLRPRSGQVPA